MRGVSVLISEPTANIIDEREQVARVGDREREARRHEEEVERRDRERRRDERRRRGRSAAPTSMTASR